jgi:light-regulated signal transduction histidine kinase (bacteriophytochrome)
MQTTLQEIRRAVELTAEPEDRQTTDLGLLVDQFAAELSNDYPSVTLGLKHVGLPKVIVERKKLALAMRSVLSTIVRRAGSGPVDIEVAAQPENERLTIRVTNSRPNWSDQDITRAFDYGRNAVGRTVPEAEGFSIDLSVAREIVDSMGGAVELVRGSGRGAIAVIRLPI